MSPTSKHEAESGWPWFLVEWGFYFALFFEPWGPVLRYSGWFFCLVGLAVLIVKKRDPVEGHVLDGIFARILWFVIGWSVISTALGFWNWYYAIKGVSIPLEATFGLWLAALVVRTRGPERFERVWWASSAVVFAWTIAAALFDGLVPQVFSNVNTLGLYAVIALPMSLSLAVRNFYGPRGLRFILSGALFIGNLMALFLSFSLGPWLVALFEILLFLLLVRPPLGRVIKAAGFTLLVAGALVSFIVAADKNVVPRARHEITQLVSVSDDFSRFTSKRSVIWEETLDLSMERPLTGWGWIQFRTLFEKTRGKLTSVGIPFEPHNMYLTLLTAGGVPLLAAGLALFLRAAWLAFRKLGKVEGDLRYLYAAVFTVMTAILIYGMAGSIFSARHKVGFLFWALCGVAVAGSDGLPGARKEAESKRD